MRINHNLMALNTHRQLAANNAAGARSIEKLSSGLRINRAGDDAAGLSISEKMRGQIRGLNQASRNAQDAISLIQTAEGGLNETHAILQRMRELAVQAANDTNIAADRTAIGTEISALVAEIDRIAATTQFNEKNLLDGTLIGATNGTFLIGANATQNVALTIRDMRATGAVLNLGATAGPSPVNHVDVSTNTLAETAITNITNAIAEVSTERSTLGALQNRLDHTINNLGTSAENLTAAESRIRDVDMAKEMVEFTKNNILSQAAQAMLAQANQLPQGVLQLLR